MRITDDILYVGVNDHNMDLLCRMAWLTIPM